MNRSIALIEDDAVISANYSSYLRDFGFSVDAHRTKEGALRTLQDKLPDLILLDISLNGERDAGFAICSAIRARTSTLPIIILSSHGGELDRVSGFRLGADDYITKTASLEFLVVRIEALFRRVEAYSRSPAGPYVGSDVTGLTVNPGTSTAVWNGHPLHLSLTQYWMLLELFNSPGQAINYDALTRAANIAVENNTVSAHIKAIRKAFQLVDPGFDRIRSERNRGYRWVVN